MSVAELRDRLVEISSSIARQKLVLEGLERNRIDTLRQLNTILDPISRLPFELSSDIFIRCLPKLRHPNTSTAPIIFLGICTTWADIALSTPALWDFLHVDFTRTYDFNRVFGTYLARSATRGLSITLTGSPPGAFHRLILRHAHQVKDLNLQLQYGPGELMVPRASTVFSNLKKLAISSGLSSKETSLLGLSIPSRSLFDVLRAIPGLVGCTIDDIEVYRSPSDGDSMMLTLPLLQSMRLGKHPTEGGCRNAKILNHLSLPALQNLAILCIDDIAAIDFISFLARSAAPLRSLRVTLGRLHWWNPPVLAQLFGLTPTLTELHLFWLTTSAPLLRLLLTGVLPELRTLRIVAAEWSSSGSDPLDTSSCLALLPSILSARRATMRSFHLRLEPRLGGPDDLVITHLRQLSAECGMKIHIGTRKTNYV